MESSDLKIVMGIYRKGIESRLEEINRQLIEKNPGFAESLAELLNVEKWAVQDAWEEIYGRDE